jgi:hypothetical protein
MFCEKDENTIVYTDETHEGKLDGEYEVLGKPVLGVD